jgi:ketosteroid isomerase-like protein
MSQERAEALAKLHRRTMKAFSAGDYETAFAAVAPDVEWRLLPSLPDSRLLRGKDEVIRYFLGLKDFLTWSVESKEFTDAGNGRFFAHLQGTAVGRATDLTFTLDFFHVQERGADGLIARVHEYERREEALEAAGLSEQDAHADS